MYRTHIHLGIVEKAQTHDATFELEETMADNTLQHTDTDIPEPTAPSTVTYFKVTQTDTSSNVTLDALIAQKTPNKTTFHHAAMYECDIHTCTHGVFAECSGCQQRLCEPCLQGHVCKQKERKIHKRNSRVVDSDEGTFLMNKLN